VCVCAHHLSHTQKINETITGDHATYDAIFASPRRRHDNDRTGAPACIQRLVLVSLALLFALRKGGSSFAFQIET
jgi:hypothetical protein